MSLDRCPPDTALLSNGMDLGMGTWMGMLSTVGHTNWEGGWPRAESGSLQARVFCVTAFCSEFYSLTDVIIINNTFSNIIVQVLLLIERRYNSQITVIQKNQIVGFSVVQYSRYNTSAAPPGIHCTYSVYQHSTCKAVGRYSTVGSLAGHAQLQCKVLETSCRRILDRTGGTPTRYLGAWQDPAPPSPAPRCIRSSSMCCIM
jgi:hypothetical protein